MSFTILKFNEWTFEVDKNLTESNYKKVELGSAEECSCNDCKNYVAYRDNVYPSEILQLFLDLGIDYKKDAEIYTTKLENGQHLLNVWFHFKGRVLEGKDYRAPLQINQNKENKNSTFKNFEIGFFKGNDLTFFDDKINLVQIEFMTQIPWVIDKSLETT